MSKRRSVAHQIVTEPLPWRRVPQASWLLADKFSGISNPTLARMAHLPLAILFVCAVILRRRTTAFLAPEPGRLALVTIRERKERPSSARAERTKLNLALGFYALMIPFFWWQWGWGTAVVATLICLLVLRLVISNSGTEGAMRAAWDELHAAGHTGPVISLDTLASTGGGLFATLKDDLDHQLDGHNVGGIGSAREESLVPLYQRDPRVQRTQGHPLGLYWLPQQTPITQETA